MDCELLMEKRLDAHIEVVRAIQEDAALKGAVKRAAEAIAECFRRGGRVYFCGNGGSAADAQHLAAEFSGKFYLDRPALPSEALHCNTSYLTAVANDYSYDLVYQRLISGVGKRGDILAGLSTSGNSGNICRAFDTCREAGITTIAFTGASGGLMREKADILLNVPSSDTPRIQECHITLGHILCEWVEAALFG